MSLKELRKKKQIVILCEGETEVIAVKEFIRRKWVEDDFDSIGIRTIDLKGKLKDVHKKTPKFSEEKKVIAIFTLVDLHEFKVVDLGKYKTLTEKISASKKWLKKKFKKEVLDKFHPHLAVHETEAWIFADGAALANRLGKNKIKPHKNAEKINDMKPPKKRLNDLFIKYKGIGYSEIKEGTPLFNRLNFEKVYSTCPNFRKFYDDLKSVAQAAQQ